MLMDFSYVKQLQFQRIMPKKASWFGWSQLS